MTLTHLCELFVLRLGVGEKQQMGAGYVATLISNPFRMHFATSKCMNMKSVQSKKLFECACSLVRVERCFVSNNRQIKFVGRGCL